ncbi:hypothetical protein [Polycladidibacter hongkongensis]|uniref:hypothetical protein n=1 Tax=Polycladidibacter hongkongensis TaxID=1647556 RepID=UPI00082B1C0F|nr:hypothetical protein [Pseudovibrio hongkongensis]
MTDIDAPQLDISKPITTKEQAEAFCTNFQDAMADLVTVIEKETELLREGKLSSLPEVGPEKSAAVERYMATIQHASDNAVALGNLAPDLVEDMRHRHGRLHPLLQTNLQVVSTARAVTDTVIDSVASAVGATLKPKTYDAGGSRSAPQQAARGIAVNKSL